MSDSSVPSEFLCPITQSIMLDPHIGSDGITYEKKAIIDWLKTSSISPISRLPMNPNNLVPNRGLKNLIDDYKAQHGIDDSQPASNVEDSKAEPIPTLDRKPFLFIAIIDTSGITILSVVIIIFLIFCGTFTQVLWAAVAVKALLASRTDSLA